MVLHFLIPLSSVLPPLLYWLSLDVPNSLLLFACSALHNVLHIDFGEGRFRRSASHFHHIIFGDIFWAGLSAGPPEFLCVISLRSPQCGAVETSCWRAPDHVFLAVACPVTIERRRCVSCHASSPYFLVAYSLVQTAILYVSTISAISKRVLQLYNGILGLLVWKCRILEYRGIHTW